MGSREIHASCSGRAGHQPIIYSTNVAQRYFRLSLQVANCTKLEHKDNDPRVEMCETLLNDYENDPTILDNIWFSDEAVFYPSGRVNRHNTRIWKTENSKAKERE